MGRTVPLSHHLTNVNRTFQVGQDHQFVLIEGSLSQQCRVDFLRLPAATTDPMDQGQATHGVRFHGLVVCERTVALESGLEPSRLKRGTSFQ